MDVLITLVYLLFSICVVYPPTEFVSAGFTIAQLFESYLGSENVNFIGYHMKRITITALIHSALPLGYVVSLYFGGERGTWMLAAFAATAILPLLMVYKIVCWSERKTRHPAVAPLLPYVAEGSDWRVVAAQLNTEFRSVDKVSIPLTVTSKLVATESWLIKVTSYNLFVVKQSDCGLVATDTDIPELPASVEEETQYVNVQVVPARADVPGFKFRVTAQALRDLQPRLSQAVRVPPHISLLPSLVERFVAVFNEHVEQNPVHYVDEETEVCIGCMQAPADVALRRRCLAPPAHVLAAAPPACQRCNCRALWCSSCMARWWAARATQAGTPPERWLAARATCPVCRAVCCLLDVCPARLSVCWLSWCVASACCAGTLCTVLWARFLQVPALLTVRAAAAAPAPLPAVALCLPTASVASLLVRHLSTNETITRRLTITFSNILQGKTTKQENLMMLDALLQARNVSVLDALHHAMPPCREFARKCVWQREVIPCEELFHRELTQYGVCCVMKSNMLRLPTGVPELLTDKQLRLVLRCAEPRVFFGCQLFTMYEGEENVSPVTLVPGSEYSAQLTFTFVQDSDAEELLAGSCVSSDTYSRKLCMTTCMERHCGCSHPLRAAPAPQVARDAPPPPPCALRRLDCLQRTDNVSCNCMPSCRKISTVLSLENSIMKSTEYTLDPLYEGINVSAATVIKLRVFESGSKIFTRQPTETWFTLLSSLGGVFNMFLGVGLFSALEFLFFVLVRVPAAMKTFPEMDVPITHVHTRHS